MLKDILTPMSGEKTVFYIEKTAVNSEHICAYLETGKFFT